MEEVYYVGMRAHCGPTDLYGGVGGGGSWGEGKNFWGVEYARIQFSVGFTITYNACGFFNFQTKLRYTFC